MKTMSYKRITKIINSFPDYLVIDIHDILEAFKANKKEDVKNLISNIYRFDFSKIILSTSAYIKNEKLDKIHNLKRTELEEKGYNIGEAEILSCLLTCGFDKELNWDDLEVFARKYYAISDEEKKRIKFNKEENKKRTVSDIIKETLKLIIAISSYLPISVLLLWIPVNYTLSWFVYLLLLFGFFPIPFLVHKALYTDKDN